MSTYCSICPLVRGRDRVPPSGPSHCRILFLAERPAREEDKAGRPLADRGKTGIEFNDCYLPIPGLYRQDVAVYNSVCCSDKSYRNPTPQEAAVCSAHHLPQLLRRLNPEIIVTMGAVSASLFPNISLALHHGIPQPGQYGDWEGIVFPTFHPSAGLHSTAYMIPLRQDFANLKVVLKLLDDGIFEWPSDPYPNPDYQVLRTVHDLSDYLRGEAGQYYDIGTDTEFSHFGPHCLTFSHTPGTARLIYAGNKPVLQAYSSYLRAFHPLLHFHAYLADASPYAAMGVEIPHRRFSDTMIRAYNLCIGGGGDDEDSGSARGSLGLKVLAYRHLNMRMQSFDDLVTPHVMPLVLDYLASAYSFVSPAESPDPEPYCTCGHPQKEHKPKGKSGRHSGYCLHEASDALCTCEKFTKRPSAPKPDKLTGLLLRKLKGLSTDLEEQIFSVSPAKRVDPWKRVKDWHDWERDLLETFIGPMPEKSIDLVPENELVPYACADADGTLRLATYLNSYRL